MHIYSSLNDADALVGVAALRRQGPTNADWVLAARQVGRWSDVEGLLELEARAPSAPSASAAALQHACTQLSSDARRSSFLPSLPPGAAEDFLRGLLHAGKPQTLLAVADSWVGGAGGGALVPVAAAGGVAAAWRLGNWAAADRFLKARLLLCPALGPRYAARACGHRRRGLACWPALLSTHHRAADRRLAGCRCWTAWTRA